MGELHLRRFSGEALRTFLEIEHPETHNEVPPSGYGSIGAFYTAIARGIEDFCSEGVFEQARIARGMTVVRVDQPLGRLAFSLLEPRSDDGLLNWNFFDKFLEGSTIYPVLRTSESLP